MPTVMRIGPYRLHFYSREDHEPPHIHVTRDDLEAKFWLRPVSMATNGGENGPDACQQALGVRDNVIVETRSCQVPDVTTSFDPSTLTLDALAYQDLLDAGRMLGPRLRSTGPAARCAAGGIHDP